MLALLRVTLKNEFFGNYSEESGKDGASRVN